VVSSQEQGLGIDVEAAYVRYGTMVYRRCYQLLRHPGLAEDAMQDVFVQLLAGSERFDERAISSLLFQIATHVSLNRLRSRRRRPESPDEELLQRIAELGLAEERGEAGSLLARLFGRQPPSSRVIATLHYVDGFTLEEVAEAVQMSVSGVRKRLRQLRDVLAVISEDGHV
jgi:RNA polymerase sigma-70 factor, ECF subfamily